ncbi:MAG: DUF2905 domain-containing protein [Atribacterota bacterium]
MFSTSVIARILIVTGIVIAAVGLVFLLIGKIPSFSFRLPGDILIKRKNMVFYFPLGLCILVSIILTIIFRIFR